MTAEPVEPALDEASPPETIALAVASSLSPSAPFVVDGGRAATVGVPSDAASPRRTVGPTVVGDVVLDAYRLAAMVAPEACNLEVSLLAAIGQVESGNLAGYELDADHRPDPPVLGPVLDGSPGVAAIPDTDGGQWDGNKKWDRAVGPMQFIPSSWRVAGVDMDADGERNPQDIEDAAGAAMVYLCVGGVDLSDEASLREAVYGYNHSDAYVRLVLSWKKAFDSQGLELDLAEPPPLRLTAVQYDEVTKSLRSSAARTVKARDLDAPTTRPGRGTTPTAEETVPTKGKHAFGTWPKAIRGTGKGGATAGATPSASPSPGKPSPSPGKPSPAQAAGPATAGAGQPSPSAPGSPSKSATSDAPAKAAAGDGPTGGQGSTTPSAGGGSAGPTSPGSTSPSPTSPGPTSPGTSPSPVEELLCPTPTPGTAGSTPTGDGATTPSGAAAPTDPTAPGSTPTVDPCATPTSPTSPSAPSPAAGTASDPAATDPAP